MTIAPTRPALGGIFDVEIHAPCSHQSVKARLPHRFRSHFDHGGMTHGKLNFDQRGGGNRRDTPSGAESKPGLLREVLLDPYDIRVAILTGNGYDNSIYADLEFCSALAAASNAVYLEEIVPQDDALYATLRLNFNDPEGAVEEIERWAHHPRVAGIITCTASIETPGSRRYDPIFAAAAAAGLPIAYHTTQEGRALCPPPSSTGYPSRYVEYHSGLAASAIGHATSLITNGVFARHPKLRVLYLEGGISWALPLMWQLDADWKQFRQEVPGLVERPSDYLRNHLYFTTQPIEEPANGRDLMAVYEAVGLQKNIVWSSDFPHWDFDCPNRFLPSCFSAAQRRRIYGITRRRSMPNGCVFPRRWQHEGGGSPNRNRSRCTRGIRRGEPPHCAVWPNQHRGLQGRRCLPCGAQLLPS